MSQVRLIRSFATEVIKLAAGIKDADIQALLAERNGEEYLQGGRLPSNTAAEAQYAIKMGAGYTAPIGLAATDSYDLHATKKKRNTYQKARDYATTGMKGGLTGLGVLGATNAMRGRFGAPAGAKAVRDAMRSARGAASAGASLAIADRAYRHDELPGTKTAFVNARAESVFGSPANALDEAQRTGSFNSKVVHNLGKTFKPLQLGNKFRLP